MNTIAKLGMFIAIMLTSLISSAQSKSDKIYDMFSGKDGVTSLSFSKLLLEPFEFFLDDDTKKVIYQMEKIRFMMYNEEKGDLSAHDVYDRIQKQLKGASYFNIDPDEIDCEDCDINIEADGDDELLLIGHGNRSKMDEFHIILSDEGDQCFLISFYGDISIDDLKECAKFSSSSKNIVTF